MKFRDVKAALKWYFSRDWKRGPAPVRSLDLARPKGVFNLGNLEEDFRVYLCIGNLLDKHMKPRDCVILRHELTEGESQASLAIRFGLSGDRSIRDIRDRSLKKLDKHFVLSGLISTPNYEEPTYVREQGCC